MIAAPVRKKVLQACAVLLLRSKIFHDGCELANKIGRLPSEK